MSDTIVALSGGNAIGAGIGLSAPGAKAGQQVISVVSTAGTSNLLPNFTPVSGSLAFIPSDGRILQTSGDLTGTNMIALLRG